MDSSVRKSMVSLLILGLVSFCQLARTQDEPGLDVYYDFETEEALDQSGNGRDGIVTGAPELIDGPVGKAWKFDGGTIIDMGFDIMMAADPELSIRCFILPEDTAGQHIIYEEGGGWTGYAVRVMDGEIQFATVCCDANHPPAVVLAAELPDTDDWVEIAAVFGKGKMLLYMNGQKVGEEKTDWQEIGGHGQAGSIGETSGGNTAFLEGAGAYTGGMDEFRIYSRMLQPDELRIAVSYQGSLAIAWGYLKSSH